MRVLSIVCIVLVLCGCAHRAPQAPAKAAVGEVCIIPGWFGVVVPTTTDRDVVGLCGEGLYRAEIGMHGGRYYMDSRRSVTLVSQIGADGAISNLAVSRSQDTPQYDRESIPVCSLLDSSEGFGNKKDLRLGSSRGEVLSQLGEGRQDSGNPTVWFYDIRCPSRNAESVQLIVVFEEEQLVSVTFSRR